jgi:2-phosphosulfolactate phosphatase
MRIVTSLLPEMMEAKPNRIDVAVIIDVLRATSVMTTAVESGAEQILTCREVSQAVALADQMEPRPLLCGERRCKPIAGFDCGNSPAEYTPERVGGQTLILTTTNGTNAIEMASAAERLIAASFLNLPTVIEFLGGFKLVHLVCSGTDGQVTAEDVLLAGAIIDGCEIEYGATIGDDDSILARQLWASWLPMAGSTPWSLLRRSERQHVQSASEMLSRRLHQTLGGSNLVNLGFEQDLERCALIGGSPVIAERVQQSPTAFKLLAT